MEDLTITIEGREYTKDTITDDLLQRIGGEWPKATVEETGVNIWTVDYGKLPTKIYADDQLDENGDPIEDGEGNTVEPSLPVTWNVPAPVNVSSYEAIDGAKASGQCH